MLAVADVTGGNLDPVLRVNAPDGLPVALNDDRGDGSLNSAVAFTAREAGVYIVELSRFRQGNSSGGFRLVLSSVDASVVATLQNLLANQVSLSGPELAVETQDFRVAYTLEGRDASTEDYARAVANTLQRMLLAQEQLGFAAPVRADDGRYHAYVADARANGHDVTLTEVAGAQHFDAFLAIPGMQRYRALLPEAYRALDDLDR